MLCHPGQGYHCTRRTTVAFPSFGPIILPCPLSVFQAQTRSTSPSPRNLGMTPESLLFVSCKQRPSPRSWAKRTKSRRATRLSSISLLEDSVKLPPSLLGRHCCWHDIDGCQGGELAKIHGGDRIILYTKEKTVASSGSTFNRRVRVEARRSAIKPSTAQDERSGHPAFPPRHVCPSHLKPLFSVTLLPTPAKSPPVCHRFHRIRSPLLPLSYYHSFLQFTRLPRPPLLDSCRQRIQDVR